MPRLIVLAGPALGADFDVRAGAVIGRDPGCDAVLEGRSISRRHARLEEHDGRWTLVDLGSRNGVRKGGRLAKRLELVDRDEFLLGELLLRFVTGDAAEASEPEIEGLERLDDPRSRARAATPAPDRAGARPAADVEPDERARLLLAMRQESRAGLLSSDLAQQPLGVRLALLLLALLAGAGMLWLAYQATLYLRAA